MTLIKMNFVLLICFSVLILYVQGKSESAKKPEIEPSVEIIDDKQNEGGIKESGNVEENEKKEKVETNVGEGKGEKEGETVSGENGKNSMEGKDEDGVKIKDFNEIVAEDREIVKKYYSKIKPQEEKKKENANVKGGKYHHTAEKSSKVDELQGVANAIANGEMKCPGMFKRMFGKAVNLIKRDPEAERKEQEWSQNCQLLSQMKTAMVDWLEFIAKYDEKSPNGRKVGENTTKSVEESAPEFPEKMTVRPILQKVYPKQNEKANKQQKDGQYVPPEFENESVGMKEMLEIYLKIAEGKEPVDLKQLFWDNEAAYKFVKKLELKLESDQKHENMAAQDKDEEDLKEIWEEEKGVLSGQMSEFKVKKHQDKYSEHIDEQKEKKYGVLGTLWNYGKTIKNLLPGQKSQSKQLSISA